MPVGGGKMRSDEIFQEIKKTVDAVSPLITSVYCCLHVLLFACVVCNRKVRRW